MRRLAAVLILTMVAISLLVVTLLAHRREAEFAVTVYDPSPTHIWNRLHSLCLFATISLQPGSFQIRLMRPTGIAHPTCWINLLITACCES